MKYFYDTEFIEDGNTIDLISIGVVAEHGRTFYAISTEFNPKKASQWVKDNVLAHLPPRYVNLSDVSVSPRLKEESLKWMSRQEIRNRLRGFCNPDEYGKPEFWGYYADYDHVALCQLFGTMMDLPKGWPMYTRDIKQLCVSLGNPKLPKQGKGEHHALADAQWNRTAFEFLSRGGPSDGDRARAAAEEIARTVTQTELDWAHLKLTSQPGVPSEESSVISRRAAPNLGEKALQRIAAIITNHLGASSSQEVTGDLATLFISSIVASG